ncbi:methyltransferase domain-containing protein [Massilia sp. YIM B04103]|uniref:methyltransferase domain-containing protein n=1 Tax=Massilia sp. YIM B04103 TaxID=2963106 RepID=UPI00210CC04E|nr:methyltransferase domain-containing protein [Massilia sp. YIM B04103]
MLSERVPETDNGLQGVYIATEYDEMQRHIRDSGWLGEKIDLLLDCEVRAGSALEIGPGPGYFGLEWLKTVNDPEARLTALDISDGMLDVARRNAAAYGLTARSEYVLGDCQRMPFPDNHFDVLFTHSSLHEWVDPVAVLSEVHRVLKPGGRYCVIDLRRDLSKEAIAFMRGNINIAMRKGFANSVKAAYTSAELRSLLESTPLTGARVQDIELGLFITGVKQAGPLSEAAGHAGTTVPTAAHKATANATPDSAPDAATDAAIDLYHGARTPEQLLAALLAPRAPAARLAQLNAALKHAAAASPFYRRWYTVRPLDSLDELATLGFTTKEDLRTEYPYGLLAVAPERLTRYAESTGTTGGVNAGFVTARDWSTNQFCVALAWAELLGRHDIMAVAVPYELSYVGADIDRVAELLGASVLAVGTNNRLCPWTRLLALLRSHQVTTLVCAPIRALRLAALAAEQGIDLRRDLAVRRIVCVGEALSPARKAYIESLWGASVYNHYGMTEAMAVALPCRQGELHLAEQRFVFEVINPDSGAVLPPGATGELVLTTLAQEAMPLVRYRTGDLVRIDASPCSCGNAHARLVHLGRVQDCVGAAGQRFHIGELDEILLAEPGIEPIYSVQGDAHHVAVHLIAAEGANWHETRARLTAALEAYCRLPVELVPSDRAAWFARIDNHSKPGTAPPPASPLSTKETTQ